MNKLLTLIGATAGSWIGWSLGAHEGVGTAVGLSAVGTFVGVYAGWWLWQRYLR